MFLPDWESMTDVAYLDPAHAPHRQAIVQLERLYAGRMVRALAIDR